MPDYSTVPDWDISESPFNDKDPFKVYYVKYYKTLRGNDGVDTQYIFTAELTYEPENVHGEIKITAFDPIVNDYTCNIQDNGNSNEFLYTSIAFIRDVLNQFSPNQMLFITPDSSQGFIYKILSSRFAEDCGYRHDSFTKIIDNDKLFVTILQKL